MPDKEAQGGWQVLERLTISVLAPRNSMKNIITKPACRLKLQLFGGFSSDANLSCCFLLGCRTEAILFAAAVTVGTSGVDSS